MHKTGFCGVEEVRKAGRANLASHFLRVSAWREAFLLNPVLELAK